MAVGKSRRIVGAATALLGAGAACAVMAAPASASVSKIEITTPSGYGSTAGLYGAGCSYDVEATVTGSETVAFTVAKDGTNIGSKSVQPSNSKAAYTFEPESPGTYTIKAFQKGNPMSQSVEAKVGTGIQLPSTGSVELPLSGSCIVLG
ncbi:hypothetical protein GTV32_02915 [Gordonia sp. SID5947]|uniref:hypothetical protein n=1 Tax=Gordonia sp. SID5947 TaxID=2690315 RepID=UPI00136DDC32|nr:hypothetical protein [Gordonia sp. SID5947]MYR05335.1 hypothetical protein [Gordonia sp. SID5947]